MLIAYRMNGEMLYPENGYPVRAVIPGLVRQTVGLALRHLGNPRVLEVPARLGYPSARTTLAEILDNPVPHP